MKTFLKEITLLTLFTLSSFYGLYVADKPLMVQEFTAESKEYQVINLGNSHGNSFGYSGRPFKGKAFNYPGNTLYYDLQDYKYLASSLDEKCLVILPISYTSFGLDENRTDKGPDSPFVDVFYEYLPNEAIYEYSSERERKIIWYRVQQNFKNFFRGNIKTKGTEASVNHLQDLADHANRRVPRHRAMGTFSDPMKNINYLSQLIESIIKQGHTPVLVTTPLYESYTDGFDQEWLQENFTDHLFLAMERHEVSYFDYATHKQFNGEGSLFANSDHLNREGQKKFTDLFLSDLEARGIYSFPRTEQ